MMVLPPININLEGATKAVEITREILTPWRRKHAEKMAKLEEQEKRIDIKKKEADLEIDKIEADKKRLEAEGMQLEHQKTIIDIQKAKIELALQILASVAPNLEETQKIEHVIKLMPMLSTITNSPLELLVDSKVKNP